MVHAHLLDVCFSHLAGICIVLWRQPGMACPCAALLCALGFTKPCRLCWVQPLLLPPTYCSVADGLRVIRCHGEEVGRWSCAGQKAALLHCCECYGCQCCRAVCYALCVVQPKFRACVSCSVSASMQPVWKGMDQRELCAMQT